MAKEKLLIDKTELVAADLHIKKPRVLNLTYDKITGIYFEPAEVRFLVFLKKKTDRIRVAYRGQPMNQPLYFLRSEEGDARFEQYMAGLRKFAWDNQIPLTDQLSSGQA